MIDFLYSAGAFVLALAVLITIHEFGHFWVARKLGVKILRFSVGFGSWVLTLAASVIEHFPRDFEP